MEGSGILYTGAWRCSKEILDNLFDGDDVWSEERKSAGETAKVENSGPLGPKLLAYSKVLYIFAVSDVGCTKEALGSLDLGRGVLFLVLKVGTNTAMNLPVRTAKQYRYRMSTNGIETEAPAF
jgi:hypothetical protein